MGWKAKAFLFLQNIFHRLLFFVSKKKQKRPFSLEAPEKILLSNWASLGDLFLSMLVFQAIRDRFPQAKIGFLVSKHSRKVLQSYEGIDFIHEVEGLAKNYPHFFAKLKRWALFLMRERRALIHEIKEKNYSWAIELYPFFPNTISLFWSAKIPFLIGFDRGGGSFLLDLIIDWKEGSYLKNQYETLISTLYRNKLKNREFDKEVTRNFSLEREIIVEGQGLSEEKNCGERLTQGKTDSSTCFSICKGDSKKRFSNQLKSFSQRSYLILHPFSSLSEKDFPLSFWQRLYFLLKQEGFSLYFTGDGKSQREAIQKIGATEEENLCGKLSWQEFVDQVEKSRAVISVDTVTVHVAAFFNLPLFLLYQRKDPLWVPSGKGKKIYSSKDFPEQVLEDVKELYKEGFRP